MMKMGNNKLAVILVLAMLVVFSETSTAFTFCKMSEQALTTCKPSVTKPNPVDPNTTGCCKALKDADLVCLCSYKGSPMLASFGITSDLAMGLPAKCGLNAPAGCA